MPPQKAVKDADAHATYRIGTLYHVRMAEPGGQRRAEAVGAAAWDSALTVGRCCERAARRGCDVQRYDMSLAGEESWIKFHDQGVHRGSIVDTDRGAKLESGSGDFAEWQERVSPNAKLRARESPCGNRPNQAALPETSRLGAITAERVVGPQDPEEDPFEEGDVVAFGETG